MRLPRPAPAMTVIGAALLWSTMAAAQDRSSQDRPALVEGRPVAAVQGVWRSRGYGYVVVIGQDGPAMFHVAGDFCYADPRQERDPDGLLAYYRPLGRNTVAFSGEPGQTRIVFDRLRALPAACGDTGRWSPARIAALTAATFADLYPSFAERGIDWRARTAAVERALNDTTDDAALFKTLRSHAGWGRRSPRRAARRGGGRGTRSRARRRAHTRAPARWQERGRPAHRGTGVAAGLSARRPRHRAPRQGTSGRGRATVLWGRVGDVGYLNLMSMKACQGEREDRDVLDAALDQAHRPPSRARARSSSTSPTTAAATDAASLSRSPGVSPPAAGSPTPRWPTGHATSSRNPSMSSRRSGRVTSARSIC